MNSPCSYYVAYSAALPYQGSLNRRIPETGCYLISLKYSSN